MTNPAKPPSLATKALFESIERDQINRDVLKPKETT